MFYIFVNIVSILVFRCLFFVCLFFVSICLVFCCCFFVEYFILYFLHICQYSFYIGLSFSFFHLSIFRKNQTILLSFFYLKFFLDSLVYYHLLVIYYQIFLL